MIEADVHPASTVVLLRDVDQQMEVFMVRRLESLAFMGGAYVFPGGRVDDADGEGDSSWCDGVDRASARLPGCTPREAIGYHVAAIRELFEEGGVLLAHGDAENVARFARRRPDVLAAPRAFRSLVEGDGLRLDLGALVPCAHWVTPKRLPRRFDTRFFAALMAPGQVATHDSGETTESAWLSPDGALMKESLGDIQLPVPTRHTLDELRRFSSAGEALAWYASHPVERYEPM